MLKRLKIRFSGSIGVDEGGLTKEMFGLFFQHAPFHLASFRGMGRYLGDAIIYRPGDPMQTKTQGEYEIVGRILAKAIIEEVPIPQEWVQSFMLRFVLHNHEPTPSRVVPLDNLHEDLTAAGFTQSMVSSYVGDNEGSIRKFAQERLVDVRRGQLEELQEGALMSTLGPALSMFSIDDLKCLMCGNSAFSATDLFQTITFERTTPEFSADFREALEMLEAESKLNDFLQYTTALLAIPPGNCFSVTVQWDSNKVYLCKAQTCINQLVIAHATPVLLKEWILEAIKVQQASTAGFTNE